MKDITMSEGHHHCVGGGCGHASHHRGDDAVGLRPARVPTPIPAQPLPDTAALAIHGVRSRLALKEGMPLGPGAPRMFLRAIASLGDAPRLMRIHDLTVRLDPDVPATRARLTAALRERTGLAELRPTRNGDAWTYEFGIEAVLDPAIAASIWFIAARVPEVASSRLSGYTSSGMWTVEDGLEEGSYRIVQAGPVGEDRSA